MLNEGGYPELQQEIAAIGFAASAGGLAALATVLHALPPDWQIPIFIVQHLAPKSASHLHIILQKQTPLKVKQAEDDEEVCPGIVYVAPPNWHLTIDTANKIRLERSQMVHFLRPAADVLFFSLADTFKALVIGVVLTGSGHDGAAGAEAIKKSGGTIIVQDKHTSEFWGMPEAVVRIGAADYVLPLPEIAPMLIALSHYWKPS